ncbi:SRPBCC family protein [Kordiimonas aquimaris]|uniref:SRPBCC family protein n=1 Tax=Kordiimonas aquimaris TaxID=707591 RepID=UPI0021D263A0|nr:SRPBCC family protein [Kordiimonas aquimaris]
MVSMKEKPVRLTAPGTIVLERILPGPIERVWAYLTESDKRAKWVAAGNMDLREGGSYEYIFDNEILSEEQEEVPEKYKDTCGSEITMNGHIIAVKPPTLLHMTWAEGEDEESEVKFELEAIGDKVKLTLTHSKLFDRDMLIGVSAGWQAHVGIMCDNLAGVPARPFWKTHMELEELYAKTLFNET